MRNHNKKLAKNASYLIIVQLVNLALPFISLPIISRILGVENFGLINYAIAFVNYFILLIDYSFNFTATRLVIQKLDKPKEVEKIFNQILSTKIVLFLISTCLFLIIIYLVELNHTTKILMSITFLYTISTVLNNNWMYQAFQNLSKVAIFSLINKLTFTILILYFVQKKDDLIIYSLIYSLTAIITSALSFYYIVKNYSIKFSFVRVKEILNILQKEHLVFLSLIVISCYTTSNIIILGITSSATEIGLFSSSEKIIVLITTILNISFSQALYPYITQSFNTSKELGINKVQKILPITTSMVAICCCFTFILSDFIVNILYGTEFTSAIFLIKVMIIIPIFISFSNMFGIQLMLNLKLDKQLLIITCIGAFLGITSNFILSSKFHALGTCISWIISEFFITLFMYIILRKNGINPINLNYYHPAFIKTQFKSLLMTIVKK